MEKDTKKRSPVEALRKGLEVLELLSQAESPAGLPLAEIAAEMGFKRTTTHNLLKTLSLSGFARNSGDGHYCLGWKTTQLLRNRLASGTYGTAVVQALSDLAAEIDESVVMATLSNGRRQVVARIEGNQLVQVNPTIFEADMHYFWKMVTGRLLAAFSEPEELENILENEGFPGVFWKDIQTREQLAIALAPIRHSGRAESGDKAVMSFAVPVLFDEHLIGALGVYLPTYRWSEKKRQHFHEAMLRTAERISVTWQER